MASRFQFSIRSLLLLSAVAALTAASYVWQPSIYSLAARGVMTVVIASLLLVASIFSMGMKRAFFVGAALPAAIAAIASGFFAVQLVYAVQSWGGGEDQLTERAADTLRFNMVYWCFAPINGTICSLAYWLLCHDQTK